MQARFLVLFVGALLAGAQTPDAAAGLLTAKIMSHLAADEVARLSWNDVSPAGGALDAATMVRLKTAVTRGLARRPGARKPVDITVTFSWNSKDDSLLIAEIPREDGKIVEMVDFPRPTRTVAGTELSIERALVWQQAEPILDLAVAGDRMWVLDPKGVTRYERRQGAWVAVEAAPIPMEPVRDPRGRLEIDGDTIVAEVPGLACRGSQTGPLELDCAAGGSFSPGRNTLEEAGWPPHFSHVVFGSEHLVAEMDGSVHVYDRAHKQLGAFTGWGSDFVVTNTCAGEQVLAAANDTDTVALFDMVDRAPIRKSGEAPFPGTILGLLAHEAPVVVERNTASNQYEAYRITVACVR